MTRTQAIPNRTLITVWGRKPPIAFPGKSEDSVVGRPNKYLMGPALVIPQDTSRVPIVDRISTTGKDPESVKGYPNSIQIPKVYMYLLRCGYQEAPAAITIRICWWLR